VRRLIRSVSSLQISGRGDRLRIESESPRREREGEWEKVCMTDRSGGRFAKKTRRRRERTKKGKKNSGSEPNRNSWHHSANRAQPLLTSLVKYCNDWGRNMKESSETRRLPKEIQGVKTGSPERTKGLHMFLTTGTIIRVYHFIHA